MNIVKNYDAHGHIRLHCGVLRGKIMLLNRKFMWLERNAFMRKKTKDILVILLCCLVPVATLLSLYVFGWCKLSPKDTLVLDDDYNLIYHGTKYIDTENYSGLIRADYNSADFIHIATLPRTYLLPSVSEFYGDELENPDLIYCTRGENLWIKEGMNVDDLIMNNNCVVSDSFSFRICDVITDEKIPYSSKLSQTQELVDFGIIPLEDYPAFGIWVTITSVDGKSYLQYGWDSDFYEITDEFMTELRENGFMEQ